MGIIVGSDYIYASCDKIGCNKQSEKITCWVGEQCKAEDKIRRTGWQISFTGPYCYCPDHAYKI